MKVLLLMLDALRPDALMNANAPHLHEFRETWAATLTAQSVVPPITLPCHTSIFHSAPPAHHGITDNVWHAPANPVTGLVEQLDLHDKTTAFYHNWDVLRDLTRHEKLHFSYTVNTGYNLDGDEAVLKGFLHNYAEVNTDFAFVYFASIDNAGHAFGWMSAEYMAQVEKVDALVGRLLAVLPDDVTIIIHSDHGGHDTTHGDDIPADMTIPWMIGGANVRRAHTITRPVSLLDTAPTIAHLLGVPTPTAWQGTPVTEALADPTP